jgi:nucleotide-binding universal stress UspA family protein
MSYQKILVTLDGSQLAETALEHVQEVARPNAEVHLLSVVGSIEVTSFVDTGTPMLSAVNAMYGVPAVKQPAYQRISDPTAYQGRTEYLRQISEPLLEQGYTVVCEVEPGNVVSNIVNTAKDGFDLIIMTTHGRTGIRRTMLGSVAEAVLRLAPCPVLVIRSQ